MKKAATLLVVILALTTASSSFAQCECRERPRPGFDHHGRVLLVKEDFGRSNRVLREFEYRGLIEKRDAWRRCELEKREVRECLVRH